MLLFHLNEQLFLSNTHGERLVFVSCYTNKNTNTNFTRMKLFRFQELQLHLGVLQQHAALIGGPNATSCPICHKLFLGADSLMEHMKHSHKEPTNNAPAATTASKYINYIIP